MRILWRGSSVCLSTPAAEREDVFVSDERARWASLVVHASLQARSRRPTSLASALDTPLVAEAGPWLADDEVGHSLDTLDQRAERDNAGPFDLRAYQDEITRLKGEVDGICVSLYGLDDVPLDLLRRPGDAY